jgi:hypothetical protein
VAAPSFDACIRTRRVNDSIGHGRGDRRANAYGWTTHARGLRRSNRHADDRLCSRRRHPAPPRATGMRVAGRQVRIRPPSTYRMHALDLHVRRPWTMDGRRTSATDGAMSSASVIMAYDDYQDQMASDAAADRRASGNVSTSNDR